VLLPQLSRRGRFGRHLPAQAVVLRLGIVQNTLGEGFMSRQKVPDVIFQGQFGMKFGPVMGGADESQHQIQMLQAERPEQIHVITQTVTGPPEKSYSPLISGRCATTCDTVPIIEE
jgi:hypothetical protein